MKTHTIKKNKNGIKIVTFTPKFKQKLKDSSWWSAGITIYTLKTQLKTLTGVEHRINGEQELEIANHFKYPIVSGFSSNQRMIEKWLNKGLEQEYLILPNELLDILNHFWDSYLNKS